MSAMRYAEYEPPADLVGLVERFWILEGLADGTADAILPDGRMELVFHYAGTFWRHVRDAEAVRQPASLLVGQMIEPVSLAPRGEVGVAAIRLQPGAARSLLAQSLHGCAMQELSGRFEDLDLIFPSARHLRQELADAVSDRERLAALARWLRERVLSPRRALVDAAVRAIVEVDGVTSIEAVAARASLSQRQLERHFLEDVGLAPKTFSRLIRLQAALRRVRAGSPLSDVALASGYYDQAHMTRDFRELASMSPSAWQRHSGELAALFVRT